MSGEFESDVCDDSGKRCGFVLIRCLVSLVSRSIISKTELWIYSQWLVTFRGQLQRIALGRNGRMSLLRQPASFSAYGSQASILCYRVAFER